MAVNPYEKYQQQSVMTMTQGEMLTKLYGEIVKQLSGATVYINEKDYYRANTAMKKAQKILSHLKATLNFKYEISNSLNALYDFFIQQIVAANVRKDVAPLNDVIPMVEELCETFIQAGKLARIQATP